MWLAAGQAVGEGVGGVSAHHLALLDTLRIRIGMLGHHADNLGLQPQQVAGLDQPADARTHADGHVHGVQVGHGLQQLQRIGGNPANQVRVKGRHQVQMMLGGQGSGMAACFVEVFAVLDHCGAQCAHGGVLFSGIAFGHHNANLQPMGARGQSQALAMIATGGGDQAAGVGLSGQQTLHVQHAAAHFKGAGRGMVFMLDPDRAVQLLGQQGPGQLRGRGHALVHRGRGESKGCQVKHGTPSSGDLTRF